MFWYKLFYKKFFIAILIVLLIPGLYSCRPGVIDSGPKYFNLKGYFENEVSRLTKLHPALTKSVSHNNSTQTKQVVITNWENELALFTGSDINKPAWRDEYVITENPEAITYKARKPELKTREIIIKKQGGKIMAVMVVNHTKNILYTSSEKLCYYPDSLYRIEKTQQVCLMGANNHKIQGLFN